MRKRTAGRILAVQALYQWDLRGAAFLKELPDFLEGSSEDPDVAALAEELFRGCAEHREEIDARLAASAEHYELARMAAVDRAILRLGAYELLHRPDVPPKVAIDEAIRIALKFSTAESGAFVNGILDRVMACARPDAGRKRAGPIRLPAEGKKR
jgi:N utilization substance protein B